MRGLGTTQNGGEVVWRNVFKLLKHGRLGDENGPGPSVDAPGEFPDLTTMEVASDR